MASRRLARRSRTAVLSTDPVSINLARDLNQPRDWYEAEDGMDVSMSRTSVRKMHIVHNPGSVIFVHRIDGKTPQQMCQDIDSDFR